MYLFPSPGLYNILHKLWLDLIYEPLVYVHPDIDQGQFGDKTSFRFSSALRW